MRLAKDAEVRDGKPVNEKCAAVHVVAKYNSKAG